MSTANPALPAERERVVFRLLSQSPEPLGLDAIQYATRLPRTWLHYNLRQWVEVGKLERVQSAMNRKWGPVTCYRLPQKAGKEVIDTHWDRIWRMFFAIDDRDWSLQGARFRELARLCMAAAEACDAEADALVEASR